MSQAKDDCGGRYEGTAVNLVDLSHQIKTDKHPPDHPGTTYAMGYGTEATTHWLVVETMSCSFAGGHAQSVLHAAFLTGTETELVTYNFVNDKQTGQPAVTGVKRVYKIDADALTDRYGVPAIRSSRFGSHVVERRILILGGHEAALEGWRPRCSAAKASLQRSTRHAGARLRLVLWV